MIKAEWEKVLQLGLGRYESVVLRKTGLSTDTAWGDECKGGKLYFRPRRSLPGQRGRA